MPWSLTLVLRLMLLPSHGLQDHIFNQHPRIMDPIEAATAELYLNRMVRLQMLHPPQRQLRVDLVCAHVSSLPTQPSLVLVRVLPGPFRYL